MAFGNPFTPTPGERPLYLHGRTDEFQAAWAWAHSVHHAQVTTNALLLTGNRGIGKSVVLAGISTGLDEQGWRVARLDLSDEQRAGDALRPVLDRESMRGPAARFRDTARSLRGAFRNASVSVGLDGPSASVDLVRPRADTDLARLLMDAGDRARVTARPAVVVIDNLDRWSAADLRDLCEGLAACSRAAHPIGVIAAGRPVVAEALIRADRASVFEVRRVGVLSPAETGAVLHDTAAHFGVTFEPAAHDRLVQFSQGHPDRLQLAAHEAWQGAPQGVAEISDAVAELGVRSATAKLDTRVHAPVWSDLTNAERAVAQTLAAGSRGPQSLAAVRARLPVEHRDEFESAIAGLRRQDFLYELDGGRVAFSNAGTADWIHRNRPPAGTANHVLQASPSARQIASAPPRQAQRPAQPQLGHGPFSPTHER